MDNSIDILRKSWRELDKLVRRPTERKIAKDAWLQKCLCAYRNTEGLRDRGTGAYDYCITWFNSAERDGSLEEILGYTLQQTEDKIRSRTTRVSRDIPTHKGRF